LGAGEYLKHVFLGWGLQDVPRGKILSLWIGRVSNALSSFGEVVGRMPKLNVGSKQEPIGAWFAKRHSHTAGVHNSSPSDHSVKLHVGMTADDYSYVEAFKEQ